MARSPLFVFALIIAAASAFVQPANYAVTRATQNTFEAPKMMVEGQNFAMNEVAGNANLLASNVQDFGGYLFPVFGILSLCAVILYLAPPLADPE